MLPGASWSLGLGGIRTQSALNEPFSGEIDLYDTKPDELDTVKVAIASQAEFAKAGSPRPHFLTKLRFTPQVLPSGKTIVRIDSREPIREPYIDFLVEVTWPAGRMVKGYTVLLDPPVTLNRSAPRVEPPRPVRRAPPPVVATPPPTPVTPAVPRDATGYPLRYGPVGTGTGLWLVARSMAPEDATVAQTAMALYRNNQQAFIRGDINKLKLGAQLQIPTPDELFALDAGAADAEFRSAMRGGRVTSTPLTDVTRAVAPADRLEIAAAPEPATPQPSAVPPQETEAASPSPELGSIQRDLLLVQESTESTRQETEELRARILELETQLADIKTLLELRNQQLAQLQDEAAEAAEPSAAELSGRPPEPEEKPEAAATEEEPRPIGEASEPEALVEPSSELDGEPGVAETEAQAPSETPAEISPARVPVATPSDGADSERPFWQEIPASTLGLAVGVSLLLLLLGIFVLRRRQAMEQMPEGEQLREEDMEFAPEPLPQDASIDSGLRPADAAGAEASSQTSPPFSGFSNFEDETEEADIISEADVYIAYGRYREAESLLAEELKSTPERADLKFKLAEAYFGSKNATALQGIVSELRVEGADGLHPKQWQRLLRMSKELSEPGFPLAESPRSATSSAPQAPVDAPPDAMAGPVDSDPVRSDEQPDFGSDFDLSGLLDDEEPGPVSGPQRPAEPQPQSSRPKPDADQTLSQTVDPSPRESDLAAGSLAAFGAELELSEEERVSGGAGSDFDFPIEDLEDIEGVGGRNTGDRSAELSPESPAQATAASSPMPASAGGASLDLSVIRPVGKESAASDVLSSQWQMDSGLWDEVATKIDLARAYLEMEDPEAARTILEEVTAEGNDQQKAEAREMLARLD
jgi:pilus assembly protein FimV